MSLCLRMLNNSGERSSSMLKYNHAYETTQCVVLTSSHGSELVAKLKSQRGSAREWREK